jgi:hypothetical protein
MRTANIVHPWQTFRYRAPALLGLAWKTSWNEEGVFSRNRQAAVEKALRSESDGAVDYR